MATTSPARFGTNAPVRKSVVEPKRRGNPYLVPIPPETPATPPAVPERDKEPVPV